MKNEKKRYYYARIDTFQRTKKEYGYGFANTKTAIAFSSSEERKNFLDSTYDLSAKKITRREALTYATPIRGDRDAGLGLEIFSAEREARESFFEEFLKMKE